MNSRFKCSFVLVFVLAVLSLGCDNKLNPFSPPRKITSPPERVESAPVQVPPSVTGTVIANVNNYPVTLEELNSEIENFNAAIGTSNPEDKIDTRDKKIAYLENGIIRKILLYQSAQQRGLDNKPEIRKAMENFKQSLLVAELVREETANIVPTDAEVAEYYNQYKDELKEPEQRRIYEIVVANEEQAKEISIELLKGADFGTLAQERSTAASAKNKGDLGYISMGSKFPEFDKIAFSPTLEVGKPSLSFKGPDGFYIVKLQDIREGVARPLSELAEEIKKGLSILKQQQHIEAVIEKLQKEGKIEVKKELVD